jgi:hypothetical protein
MLYHIQRFMKEQPQSKQLTVCFAEAAVLFLGDGRYASK